VAAALSSSELAVALARIAPERDRELIAAALTAADQAHLVRYLADRRLLPLLGTRAVELCPEACEPQLRAAAEAARRETQMRAMIYSHALDAATAALEDAGVPALPLKGVALAKSAHGSLALRATSDTDVLVSREDLDAAIDVLEGLGYERPTDPAWVDGRPLLHYTLRHRDGFVPALELHWRIHWSETRFSQELLATSTRAPGEWRSATPERELAALLLFFARDGFSGLRLAADIAAWWDRHGAGIGERAIERFIAANPSLQRSFEAALLVLEPLVGLPSRRLVRAPAPDWSARRAAACADPHLVSPVGTMIARIMAVDFLLSTGRDKMGFVRRYAIHPEAEVRRTYAMQQSPRAVVAARGAVHAVGALVKSGPPMARAILGR
jgi:Uncharacterised nucleotidyltransferase